MDEKPYSEDDFEWAKGVMGQLQVGATEAVARLLEARRANNPEAAAHICQQLWEAEAPHALMMVLGQLTTRVVTTERRAEDAHGPLTTPEEMGYTPEQAKPETWQLAMHDQLAAAANEGDYRAYARMAVDGQIKSLLEDVGDDEIDYDAILAAMLILDHKTMTVLAAEMLYRLTAQQRGRT